MNKKIMSTFIILLQIILQSCSPIISQEKNPISKINNPNNTLPLLSLPVETTPVPTPYSPVETTSLPFISSTPTPLPNLTFSPIPLSNVEKQKVPISISVYPVYANIGRNSSFIISGFVKYSDGSEDEDFVLKCGSPKKVKIEGKKVTFLEDGHVKIYSISNKDPNIKAESLFNVRFSNIYSGGEGGGGGGAGSGDRPGIVLVLSSTTGIKGMDISININNGTFTPVNDKGPFVYFNDICVAPYDVQSNSLKVTIPLTAYTGSVRVKLPTDQIFEVTSNFVVLSGAPEITSLSKTTDIKGAIITINGTNFSTNSTDNVVSFNRIAGTVVSATPTELKVKVPNSTTGPISVSNIAGTDTYPTYFCILEGPPTITTFTPKAPPEGSIVIEGTNFSENPSDNIVLFTKKGGGTTQGTVIVSSSTQMVVNVPLDVGIGSISVQTEAGVFNSNTDFIPLSHIISTFKDNCTDGNCWGFF